MNDVNLQNFKTNISQHVDQMSNATPHFKKAIKRLIDLATSHSQNDSELVQALKKIEQTVRNSFGITISQDMKNCINTFLSEMEPKGLKNGVSQNHIDSLPAELLRKIFSHLPSPREFSALCTVEKKWAGILNEDGSFDKILFHKTEIAFCEIQEYRKFIYNQVGVEPTICQLLSMCPNLEKLDLSGSDISDEELEVIDDYCINLKELHLKNCSNLTGIPDFHLPHLQILDLSGCQFLESIPNFQHLPGLLHLNLSDCNDLIEIHDFNQMPNLLSLNLAGCYNLKEIPDFQHLPNLLSLDLTSCTDIKEIPDFHYLSKLTTLILAKCHRVIIPSFQHLSNLIMLDVYKCFVKISHFQHLPKTANIEM